MPIYEYDCKLCGHSVEKLQKLSDPPLLDCPACHQPGLQKRISAPGFRLSGGGWYETDFKTGSKKNLSEKAAEKTASSTSAESSKSSSSTDKPSNS
jgi:putative FmdB family regulatory protein